MQLKVKETHLLSGMDDELNLTYLYKLVVCEMIVIL